MSKIAEWSWKKVDGLQELAGHWAMGRPQPLGCGAPAVMSAGIELRGKKYTETPSSSQSTAQTPISISHNFAKAIAGRKHSLA